MEIYVKIYLIAIFSIFFLVLNYDFVIYIDFTHIAASNTATDDVTLGHTQNIYYKLIIFLCSFLLKIDEKSNSLAVFDTI